MERIWTEMYDAAKAVLNERSKCAECWVKKNMWEAKAEGEEK